MLQHLALSAANQAGLIFTLHKWGRKFNRKSGNSSAGEESDQGTRQRRDPPRQRDRWPRQGRPAQWLHVPSKRSQKGSAVARWHRKPDGGKLAPLTAIQPQKKTG
ncbi:MAG: hypothetical protein HPY59_14310 [Anaerolineae bacterium]|nr:hypothetical protein [Anaerolineae bacterium]